MSIGGCDENGTPVFNDITRWVLQCYLDCGLINPKVQARFAPDAPLIHRALVGFGITDEIFGVASVVPDKLNPWYNYGMMAISIPAWTIGTAVGIAVGNILPHHVVSALGVGLYGMFLAIIIPPGRKNKVIAGLVVVSMAASLAMSVLPVVSHISSGMRTIILTVVIAGIAAVAFPIKEEEHAQ